MSLEQHRELSTQLSNSQPGLLVDDIMMHHGRYCIVSHLLLECQGVPLCLCGKYRDVPTDCERKCCGHNLENCTQRMFFTYSQASLG